jgi:hypothetical protein
VKTVVIVLVVAACGGSRVRRGWSGRACRREVRTHLIGGVGKEHETDRKAGDGDDEKHERAALDPDEYPPRDAVSRTAIHRLFPRHTFSLRLDKTSRQ